ncbi:uncharacterized protein BO96DRAFT_82464 [Aspergillus niger CBS 101883]|uniref:uncharacterized protein n=1 Tax=Aspergillus lacticoffeatus (strain CBS 101883) TaxID=1450533 RepID=UPI000D7FA19F|nr:uncharacterized protein BO96DRAFT_82464 [Aspergillus niger CBS 101883]PYH54914.1 hypothetical protein BO96DRAFT_82464 [Aspergillus niger CBS 101883]
MRVHLKVGQMGMLVVCLISEDFYLFPTVSVLSLGRSSGGISFQTVRSIRSVSAMYSMLRGVSSGPRRQGFFLVQLFFSFCFGLHWGWNYPSH